ncbi:pyridoxamine--pyruvate transaminase [Paenirhodobacter hankyongi]|uniref:Alanine--glyoxylate aminotransferase family protein n=1 Tax=Paenirhodobacter hankyongi TaxID=2294033 RepID=A0A421BLN1_9RHOB|nr:alanine--glyoxylate aminotransferase family protein [Sinirhodobacter hankyongi]RLL63959.1 alanine--glyoxylate aminotransferase family protein [Sinirhodobacter hankyongi]
MNDVTAAALAPALFTLTTGPVNCYPEVLSAIAKPVLYDYDPAFLAFYEATVLKLQKALRIQTVPVILQGEPVLGLEAAAASLVAPVDVVLNLVSGVYGAGYGEWLKPRAGSFHEIRVAYDEVIDPAAVAAFLDAHPEVTLVAICHHDTPSGTLNPIEEIGRVVRAHGALYVVDSVSAWAGVEMDLDAVGADLLVTGPNKCLGCPPALSILAVSDRAWAKMETNPAAPRASMLSILDWKEAWRKENPFPFTPSVAEINALDAGLDRYLGEGPEAVWARHATTAAAMRAGVLAMGLELWAARPAIASPTCTAVKLPAGVDETALRTLMKRRYGVVISSGRAETFNRLVRIGHMGPTAHPLYAVVALTALGGAMAELTGRAIDIGAGVAAAEAVIRG